MKRRFSDPTVYPRPVLAGMFLNEEYTCKISSPSLKNNEALSKSPPILKKDKENQKYNTLTTKLSKKVRFDIKDSNLRRSLSLRGQNNQYPDNPNLLPIHNINVKEMISLWNKKE